MKPSVLCGLCVLFLLLAECGGGALAGAASLGTGFVFQATLSDSSGSANGLFDIRATLYDADSGGIVFAGPIAVPGVAVVDGRVFMQLDFGVPFGDADVWLGLEVRPAASTEEYTCLLPRHRLAPVPQAMYAAEAATADDVDSASAVGDADLLDGHDAAYYLTFSNHTEIPPGLGDGDDDTLGALSCGQDEVPAWGATGWICAQDRGTVFARTAVVGPVGDPSANGTALLAALAGIPTPTTPGQAWRVVIEPGVYDLNGSSLTMKRWVDVAGSGKETTTITSSVCTGGSAVLTGTVDLAAYSELRDLTAVNTCAGETYGIAVSINEDADFARAKRVDARATTSSGSVTGSRFGVFNRGNGVVFEDILAEASGGAGTNAAVFNSGEHVLIIDCIGTVEDGASAFGLWLSDDVVSSSTTVTRGSFRASASADARAVYINSSTASLEQTTAVGDTASLYIVNHIDDNTVRASRLTATGPVSAAAYGGSLEVTVEQSRVVASGPPVTGDSTAVVKLAASQLWGDAIAGGVSCAGVWDEGWTFYSNSCP